MTTHITVSPAFRADPRGWTQRMIDRLMAPGVELTERDRVAVVAKRRLLATQPKRIPGPHLYEQLCRIARACGVLRRRPSAQPQGERRRLSAPAPSIPSRFALGAPIPPPPPLRRPPVALAEDVSETWDPAGMPGL